MQGSVFGDGSEAELVMHASIAAHSLVNVDGDCQGVYCLRCRIAFRDGAAREPVNYSRKGARYWILRTVNDTLLLPNRFMSDCN